jgi:hypothetical protein
MKHLKKFEELYLKENKENDINSKSLDLEVFSNDKLEKYSFKKVDYYYLKSSVDKSVVKEMYDMIDENEYRAFATFSDNIKYFEELNCCLIALVNYPPERFTKRGIKNKLEEVKKYPFVDEIEFPWSLKYNSYGVDFWRDIVLDFSSNGYRLRPQVEFGIYNDEEVKMVIEFFKKINILNIMTSSGLYSEMTTFDRWEEIKDYIPNKWEVKIGGIMSIYDINKFLKSDIDLAATTISFKSVYKDELD